MAAKKKAVSVAAATSAAVAAAPVARAKPVAKPLMTADQRTKVADMARRAIFKATKGKTVKLNLKPIPAVSSGSTAINDMIGGTPAPDGSGPICPGYARRYFVEVYGPESSGKTTAALQAVAEVQKAGGVAMYLDFEHCLQHGYAKKVGVSFDDDKLLLYEPKTMEEGFKYMYVGLKAGVDLIVADSVAAMIPANEMDKAMDKAAQIGLRAKLLADFLPKLNTWLKSDEYSSNPLGTAVIFVNQTRALISTGGYSGGGGGGEDNTAGGKALKFYAFGRLKFTKIKNETVKRKDPLTGKERSFPYGTHTQVKLIKNKADGKIGYTADIFIRYGQGIDDVYSMIESAAANKVVGKSGAQYSWNGTSYTGRDKLRAYLVANPGEFEELRAKVLDAVRGGQDVTDADLEDEDLILESMTAAFEEQDENNFSEAGEEAVEASDFDESDVEDSDD